MSSDRRLAVVSRRLQDGLVGMAGLALVLAPAHGAPGLSVAAHPSKAFDCLVAVEHAGGTLDRRARVGEVDRRTVPGLQRLHNQGPHDVRATFDRLAPRVLQRGEAEPVRGQLQAPITLLSLECLPARAVSAAGPAAPAPPPKRAIGHVAAIHTAHSGDRS